MFNRHDLVYLKNNFEIAMDCLPDEQSFLQNWVNKDFPLIIPRQLSKDDTLNTIKVALPYFDTQINAKYRYSFSIYRNDIKRIQTLPKFANIFPEVNQDIDLSIFIYGSYAWQYLTGIQYVTDGSDLDILIMYKEELFSDIYSGVHQLKILFPNLKIDGEIRLPKFGDCQIQEFINKDAIELLFKTRNDVILIKRDTINAEYPKLAIK